MEAKDGDGGPSLRATDKSQWDVLKGKHILVTGGAGYIGSHTVIELIENGCIVTIVDNFCNSNIECVNRVAELTGTRPQVYRVDLRDIEALDKVFKEQQETRKRSATANNNGSNGRSGSCAGCTSSAVASSSGSFSSSSGNESKDHAESSASASDASPSFDAVIHFAGLKAVGESVSKPLLYHDNNVVGTIMLLKCMDKYGCRQLVFSSSATVYGNPSSNPITESESLKPTNPYGQTKYLIEEILRDLSITRHVPSPQWKFVLLRYFNPVGAHPSGRIGEDPRGIPNNLTPYVTQVAVGRLPHVNVFGADWPTRDGTGVRDYIHVVDLAQGHLSALALGLFAPGVQRAACDAYNLGTGAGYSVLDVVRAVEKAAGKTIPYKICGRRAGDIATCFADASKAERVLRWKASMGIDRQIEDAWRWQSKNPNGFAPSDSSSSSSSPNT